MNALLAALAPLVIDRIAKALLSGRDPAKITGEDLWTARERQKLRQLAALARAEAAVAKTRRRRG